MNQPLEGVWRFAAALTAVLAIHLMPLFAVGLHPVSAVLLGLALLALLSAVLGRGSEPVPDGLASRALAASVLIEVVLSASVPIVLNYQTFPRLMLVETAAWLAVAGLIVAIAAGRVGPWSTWALFVAQLLIGALAVYRAPDPGIDVYNWHRAAFGALLDGVNPYAVAMPNIYGSTRFYADGWADQQWVYVGFPYPPLSLGYALLSHLLLSDFRYGNVLAIGLAGLLLSRTRPGARAALAAAVLWFAPGMRFMVQKGWTEPVVVLAAALFLYTAARRSRWLPISLGLFLASKQYSVLLAPLLWFAVPERDARGRLRLLATSMAIAMLTLVPALVAGPEAFLRSVVVFQGKQPYRPDSLSFLAIFSRAGAPALPVWTSFPAAALAVVATFVRRATGPGAFALGASLVYLCFFGFAKQAFFNYFFLAGALGCLALGLGTVPPPFEQRT